MNISTFKHQLGKHKLLATAAVIAACFLCFSSGTHAGQKSSAPVSFSQWTSGNTSTIAFSGSLGDTRNSLNSRDSIGCIVTYQTGGVPTGYCTAYSETTSTGGECQTTDPQFVQLISSLKGDSNLYILGSGPVGQTPTCSYIWLSNASYYSPKQP